MANKNPQSEISSTEKPIFFWEAVDFQSHDKPSSWTAIVIGVTLVLGAIFVFMRLWLAVAVVVAAAVAMISQSNTRGKKRSYALYEQGATIDDKVYAYDQFKSYWVFPYQDRFVVRFEQLKRFSLPIEMPIVDENPDQIRLFLAKHLPEDEQRGEDISDTINRWIKF